MRTTKMRSSKLALVFIALAAMIAIPATMALADTLNVNELNFSGDVTKAPGGSGTIEVYLTDPNNSPTGDVNGCNAQGSNPVTVTLASNNPKVTVASPGTVTLTGCGTTSKQTIGYSVASDATSGTSATISGTPSGGRSGSQWVTTDTLKVLIDSPNQAPTKPGAPSLATGSNPNNTGEFSLSWTASTDTADSVNDSVTYTLQHKDADDAAFSNVATGLTSNSYSFAGSSAEAEGSWLYRVVASDTQLSSAFSDLSDPVIVVDKSDPSAPTASTNPAGHYYLDWFKDSVTVSYSGSTDPDLADGSAGSGIASYTANQPFSSSGTHNYSGTATDNAGNESAETTGSVKVDATNPTVDLTCPTAPVIKGSTASANWTASDGESGLKTASSGSVPLDTSSVGEKTATAPAGTAQDNVDHNSAADTCTYNVIFNWSGFFSPVDNNGVFNSAKAGQSIPLKFSLSGDQGLGVIAAGFPKVTSVTCPSSSAPVDAIEEYSTTTTNNGLTYDATADQYNYVWKTDKAWAGKCFRLDMKLTDLSTHSAVFKFTK